MSLANILLTTTRSFPKGDFQSQIFQIPPNWKKVTSPLRIMIELQAENFPTGVTTIGVQFSQDGGLTFNGPTMTCVNPAQWKGPAPHYWFLAYELSDASLPDHAFYTISTLKAFSTEVIISVG